MNKCTVIGNLTRDPELRTANTSNGSVNVCSFTVAANRRQKGQNGQNEADYFRCTAWRGLADVAANYLHKGSKVYVAGPVSVRTYQANDGGTRASMELTVEDFEFVDSRQTTQPAQKQPVMQPVMQPVNVSDAQMVFDDIPF